MIIIGFRGTARPLRLRAAAARLLPASARVCVRECVRACVPADTCARERVCGFVFVLVCVCVCV